MMYVIFFALLIASIPLSNSRSFDNEDENENSETFTNAQRRFQSQILRAHNKYRAQHCAPSLQLDDELSHQAQAFAEQLAESGTLRQGGAMGAGQNLFSSSSSVSVFPLDGKSLR